MKKTIFIIGVSLVSSIGLPAENFNKEVMSEKVYLTYDFNGLAKRAALWALKGFFSKKPPLIAPELLRTCLIESNSLLI